MGIVIQQTPARSFNDNWRFQAAYYSAIKAIIQQNALHFIKIEIADRETDMKRATDFVVTVLGGDVAVRIRRADKPFRDWTIRSYSRGFRTEIDKLREGFGRFYLYCWENEHHVLGEWILIDLDKVRELGLLDNRNEIPNLDGTTRFVAITAAELRSRDCLVASNLAAV